MNQRLAGRSVDILTGTIARSEHEAELRERLCALGRLSTVIAHEVRNPLMVIKGSLRAGAGERLGGPTSASWPRARASRST